MEDYERPYIGEDYPLDKDSLNRLAMNDDYLYQKICVESPRGIVLWKQKTSNLNLDSSTLGLDSSDISDFTFTWTPEDNRIYKACFSYGRIISDASATDGRYILAIYLDGISQNGFVSWSIGGSQTRCGFLVEAIIEKPSVVEHTISVRCSFSGMYKDLNIQGSSTSPIQFWIEDIGSLGGIVDK